jgi:hypothetical protein
LQGCNPGSGKSSKRAEREPRLEENFSAVEISAHELEKDSPARPSSHGLGVRWTPSAAEDFESLTDPVAERLRWRQLLDRKARLLETSSDDEQDSEKQRAIKQMLGLLLTYQVMEDELIARQLVCVTGIIRHEFVSQF